MPNLEKNHKNRGGITIKSSRLSTVEVSLGLDPGVNLPSSPASRNAFHQKESTHKASPPKPPTKSPSVIGLKEPPSLYAWLLVVNESGVPVLSLRHGALAAGVSSAGSRGSSTGPVPLATQGLMAGLHSAAANAGVRIRLLSIAPPPTVPHPANVGDSLPSPLLPAILGRASSTESLAVSASRAQEETGGPFNPSDSPHSEHQVHVANGTCLVSPFAQHHALLMNSFSCPQWIHNRIPHPSSSNSKEELPSGDGHLLFKSLDDASASPSETIPPVTLASPTYPTLLISKNGVECYPGFASSSAQAATTAAAAVEAKNNSTRVPPKTTSKAVFFFFTNAWQVTPATSLTGGVPECIGGHWSRGGDEPLAWACAASSQCEGLVSSTCAATRNLFERLQSLLCLWLGGVGWWSLVAGEYPFPLAVLSFPRYSSSSSSSCYLPTPPWKKG